MPAMGFIAAALCVVLSDGLGAQTPAPSLNAEQIMQQVAANQDRAEAERAHFVYLQHADVQSRKGKLVMCQEITDSRVAPLPKGESRTLLSLMGQVRAERRLVRYNKPPEQPGHGDAEPHGDDAKTVDQRTLRDLDSGKQVKVPDTDIDMVEHMRDNLIANKDSKDGVDSSLFPLTTEEQKGMSFTLTGHEPKNGRDTYHVIFTPKDKDDYGWKGDAWIDTASLQPVVVRTALSHKLPFAVRAMLGTDVPGVGFTVAYGPEQDVWFPQSFGTEFKVRVLFFFERQIVMSVQNRNFERTHVSSTIHSEAAAAVTADPAVRVP